MMNAHVELYFRCLLKMARAQNNQLGQLVYYSALMLERDPHWSPYL